MHVKFCFSFYVQSMGHVLCLIVSCIKGCFTGRRQHPRLLWWTELQGEKKKLIVQTWLLCRDLKSHHMTHSLISVSPRKNSWESACMLNFSLAELNPSSCRNDSHYLDLHFILARKMAINHLSVTAIDNYGVNGPQGTLLRRFDGNSRASGGKLTVIHVQTWTDTSLGTGFCIEPTFKCEKITEASKKILLGWK